MTMMPIKELVGNLLSGIKPSKKSSKGKTKKKPAPPCHEGNVYVFTIGNVNIYGGGRSRDFEPGKADILISTLKGYEQGLSWQAAKTFPRFAEACQHHIVVPIITEDFKAPTLSKNQWEALVEDLKNIDQPMDALVFCVGGHGRTGTVLSVLYGLTHPDGGDPVKRIRELYCKKAVESTSQLDYIELMTGIKVEEKPSKTYTQSYNSQAYGNYYQKGLKGMDGSKKSKPRPDEMIENTVWADSQDTFEWRESYVCPGYEYVFINKNQYYREKDQGNIEPPRLIDDSIDTSGKRWTSSKNYEGYEYVVVNNRCYYRKKE